MPGPRKDKREWTFEVVEVERDPNDHFDLEQWLANLLVAYYLEHKSEFDQKRDTEEDKSITCL